MSPQELIGAAEHMLRRRRSSPRQALLATVPSDIRLDLAARLFFKPRP